AELALLLSVAAFLLAGPYRPGAVALAAAACGLGLSNKLSFVVSGCALTVVALATARPPARRSAAGIWLGTLTVTGSFWYVRNLVRTGSPVPSVHLGIGRLAFPAAQLAEVRRTGSSVLPYLTSARVWRSDFIPGLGVAFGRPWPVVLAVA